MKNIIPKNLLKKIKENGDIDLNKYIEFCLYNKKNGYYQKQESVGIDFTTSPEVSQMFGECIAILLIHISNSYLKGKKKIIELGPGNGTLIEDISRVIYKKESFKEWDFFLVEKSDRLKKKQAENLEKFKTKNQKVSWVSLIEICKQKGFKFFIGNEFFDAFPINQFQYKNKNWYEKRVIINKNEKLEFKYFKTKKMIPKFYNKFKKEGSIIEISSQMKSYIENIFNCISKHGGILLLFDYGPDVKSDIDTIQAIHKKKKCGILDYPCLSDITHHIDFHYIINLAKKMELKYYGPVSQGDFLHNLGIKARLNTLINSNKKDEQNLKKDYERLTSKNQMGELFKCLIFTSTNINFP